VRAHTTFLEGDDERAAASMQERSATNEARDA
jgi:hypothetical protein